MQCSSKTSFFNKQHDPLHLSHQYNNQGKIYHPSSQNGFINQRITRFKHVCERYSNYLLTIGKVFNIHFKVYQVYVKIPQLPKSLFCTVEGFDQSHFQYWLTTNIVKSNTRVSTRYRVSSRNFFCHRAQDIWSPVKHVLSETPPVKTAV